MTPSKPITDINFEKERQKRDHDPRTAKQSQLSSAFDKPRLAPPMEQQNENFAAASPAKGGYKTQNRKLQNLTSNIHGLQGGDANQYFHRDQNKGEVIDLILSGMKTNMDEQSLK